MRDIKKFEDGELIEKQVQRITEFLDVIGLPSDNIIAEFSERDKIGKNLPQYIYDLPDDVKREARYLSKFVVGAGFGLFDYSLNSIWNEVVLSLRKKAIAYGIDIFFDKALGGNLRASFQKEEDLAGLKDNVLLQTCEKLELITDTTYKKLAHILDMRNDIGISHPTNYTINAFELLGWLQTCIQDVLKDQPSPAAIQVKAFIDNLKTNTTTLDQETLTKVSGKVKSLATHHCDSILRTIFGIFVTAATAQVVRKNISLIGPNIWPYASDQEKYRIGIILEGYNTNLHEEKYKKGEEFFNLVSGNSYRTKSERIISLDNLSNQLYDTHYEWDNYYIEVPIIERIMTFIAKSSDIPEQIAPQLIKNILLCRIGKGMSYKRGVSPKGKPSYDSFFELLGDDYLVDFIIVLTKSSIQQRLSRKICLEQFIEILHLVRKNLVNDKHIESIDYLIDKMPKTPKSVLNTEFKKLSSSIIEWN
jgi:hypothetical protein